VNRTTLGNLGEALALCCIKIALDVNIAGDLFDKAFLRYVAVSAVVRVNA
jgi:hypothetical protein